MEVAVTTGLYKPAMRGFEQRLFIECTCVGIVFMCVALDVAEPCTSLCLPTELPTAAEPAGYLPGGIPAHPRAEDMQVPSATMCKCGTSV